VIAEKSIVIAKNKLIWQLNQVFIRLLASKIKAISLQLPKNYVIATCHGTTDNHATIMQQLCNN